MENTAVATSDKSQVVAAVICFLIGALGIHNFYLGHTKNGVIQLVLTLLVFTSPISWIWAIIDFIKILTGKMTDANGAPLA